MPALEVVVRQVAGDVLARLTALLVFGHFQLGLDGPEARFHESVVVTVGGAVHDFNNLSAAQ